MKKRRPVVYVRWCRMEGCSNGIVKHNQSGICTQCWNSRSDEVWSVLDAEGWKRSNAVGAKP